jgi:hypothetical protein
MTKIKIKKCSVPRYWYAQKIGETFTLAETKKHEVKESPIESNTCYVVLFENKEHVVIVDDCEVLS